MNLMYAKRILIFLNFAKIILCSFVITLDFSYFAHKLYGSILLIARNIMYLIKMSAVSQYATH